MGVDARERAAYRDVAVAPLLVSAKFAAAGEEKENGCAGTLLVLLWVVAVGSW